MGKKLKKKASKKKKSSQKNYDSGRIDWGLGIRSSSDSESDSESLSGMNVLSSDVPAIFPCERDESDSETIELAPMGEQERYQIVAEFKRLTDKIRDQQDLLNKRECDFKEEATNLKAQLEEGNKVRRLLKDKEDQCQKLQHEVTSLRNEVNEKGTTIKKLRERSNYYESLEAKTLSLKEDLEELNKQNKELLQALEKQENKVLEITHQLEEGRKVEGIMKKQSLEKEEQHQVEVNILKDKLEEKDKLLRFQDSTMILDYILSSQRSPVNKTSVGFHESIEGESSSQSKTRNSIAKSEILNKEMRGQSHKQPRKEILQRKYFTPPMNNVECYIILDMLQLDAEVEWFKTITQKDHHVPGTLRDIVFIAICLVKKLSIATEGI